MKLLKFSTFLKFVLIAFLISNTEERILSKKNLALVRRFKNNVQKFKFDFLNVNYDNISQLIYGVIAGFVINKLVDKGKKLSKKHIKIKLDFKKLSKIFSKCLPEANKKFNSDKKSIYNTKIFSIFVSVLPSSVASRRINQY